MNDVIMGGERALRAVEWIAARYGGLILIYRFLMAFFN